MLRALVLVVPRPDQQHVAHDDPAARRAPARLEHHRAGQVAARRPAPSRRPGRGGSRRRRGRGSRRTRSASRSAAGTATRRCRSAPPARMVSQSDRKRVVGDRREQRSPGASRRPRTRSRQHRSPPVRARARRWGRAAAPGGCPRRGCPPRRARRPAPSSATRCPCGPRGGRSARRARGRARSSMPEAVSIVMPASPGASSSASGSSVSSTSWRRACALPVQRAAPGHQRPRLPAEPRGQPAEEAAARRSPSRAGGGR